MFAWGVVNLFIFDLFRPRNMPELERLQHVNDQLKREAGIQRTKVSVTANE